MYLSPNFLNRIADLVAAQALTVRLNTGVPGNAGTDNQAVANNGAAPLQATIQAADMSRTGQTTDNDDELVILAAPNATSAGQVITHLGYWFGNEFQGWVQLAAPYTIVQDTPVSIPAGMIDWIAQMGTAP